MLPSIKALTGVLLLVIGVTSVTVACSSSSDGGGGTSSGSNPTPEGGIDAGGGTDGGGADAGGADSGPVVVNACKNFTDRSPDSAERTIAWGFPVSTAPERCMIIKKGQAVTFMGDFTTHPLLASGGDTPNPIKNADATGKVTFPKAGIFGFVCGNHPSMIGAIQVDE